jgi:hypothetical protein
MIVTGDIVESQGELLGGGYCVKEDIGEGDIDAGLLAHDAVDLGKEGNEGEDGKDAG